jgi:hypothetical protein
MNEDLLWKSTIQGRDFAPASHMVIFPWDRGTSTRPGKLLQFAMENHHAMKMGKLTI